LGYVKKIKNIYFGSCLIVALFILYTPNMIKTNKTEQSNEKLILLAKKLSLVELQVKLTEEIEVINTRIACLETDNEDSIPF